MPILRIREIVPTQGGESALGVRTEGVSGDRGFTVIELLIVVLIIGILIAIAMPVFFATRANAERKTCYANQRTLEGAVPTWMAENPDDNVTTDIVGAVTAGNPLIADHVIASPPRCPSAPMPADAAYPTLAEGAYEFNSAGDLLPCEQGLLGPHGRYSD